MHRTKSEGPSRSEDVRVWERGFWLGQVDARPIALLRIVLGACVIQTLLGYLPNLVAWFSDDGVMPRETAFSSFDLTGSASILYAVGAPWHVAVIWAMALVAAVAMTLGYRTRLASFATFVFVVGFHERLPSICDSSDDVLRIALFFLCFCRAGERYSLDAARATSAHLRHGLVDALPVRLLQLHLASVYLWTGCFKLRGAHWLDGTAVRYALHLPHVVSRGWASHLADSHAFVRTATYATLAFELLFLFAVFSPFARRRMTRIALCAGVALHLGIFATMNIGQFSYLMPLSYVVFLDAAWMDRVHRILGVRVEKLASGIARRMPARGWLTEPPAPSRPLRYVPVVAVALAVQWVAMPQLEHVHAPRAVAEALSFLGLVPNWRMFAPDPLVTDYFLTAPAEFSDGSTLDLLASSASGKTEPHGFFYSRWWKFDEVLSEGNVHVAEAWASWECGRVAHDGAHGRLLRFALVRESQRVPPFDAPWPTHRSRVLLKRECVDAAERVR